MTGRNSRLILLLVVAATCLAAATARALDPGQPPGGNFDLSHWKLQMPTLDGVLNCDNLGVDETNSVALEAGFTNAYFYTGTDGAMVFWAPNIGAITSGSSDPRSELRELIQPQPNNNGSTTVNWLPYGTHILNAQCRVLQVSTNAGASKKVIIGQIHAQSGLALPTVKLQYNNGSIEGMVKTNSTDDGSDKKWVFKTNVGLNSNITYQIKVVNGLISIVMNGVTNSLNIFQSDPNYTNSTQYYKAGNYNQDGNCSSSSNDGARVAFYAVSLFHAPSITNQPASQTVTVGSNVTFSVGAAGNPPLKYFWRLNGTNITDKTNATLSIPNVQLTNAGSYSVVITDSVGSVTSVITSSVATLSVIGPPAAPSGLTSTALSETQVRLAWIDNATDETAYAVERSLNSNTWAILASNLPAGSTNYTDATCNPSTLYYYRVNCTNANGASQYAVRSLTTPAGVGDGIPGWWRLQQFGDGLTTNSNSCASCDPDGDGQNNLAEYMAGTDPNNVASAFRVAAVAQEGDDIRITWMMAIGKTNALQAAGDNYVTIFTVTNTVGTTTNFLDTGAATNTPTRLYRVWLAP